MAGQSRVDFSDLMARLVVEVGGWSRVLDQNDDGARVVLIGPYPPPDHGTSIPFRIFADFAVRNCAVEVVVVDTHRIHRRTGPSDLIRAAVNLLLMSIRVLRAARFCRKFIILASQRFVSTIGSLYAFVLSTLGKEVHIYVHGGAFDVYYMSMHPLLRFIVRKCLSRARSLVVQTNLVYKALSNQFSNLAWVPNWGAVDQLQAFNRNRQHIAGNQRVVRFVFAGEVRREKGVTELIKAYQKAMLELRSENIAITLDIFGPVRNDFRESFGKLLVDAGRTVVHHGYVGHAELLQCLSRFDALVLPTYLPTEGYPGVLIEAMALGMPVVATRWRAIPEIVVHEESGLLCEPGNVEDLAKCLVRIALDRELRTRLGDKARETAKQFDANIVLPRLCALFALKSGTQADDGPSC